MSFMTSIYFRLTTEISMSAQMVQGTCQRLTVNLVISKFYFTVVFMFHFTEGRRGGGGGGADALSGVAALSKNVYHPPHFVKRTYSKREIALTLFRRTAENKPVSHIKSLVSLVKLGDNVQSVSILIAQLTTFDKQLKTNRAQLFKASLL